MLLHLLLLISRLIDRLGLRISHSKVFSSDKKCEWKLIFLTKKWLFWKLFHWFLTRKVSLAEKLQMKLTVLQNKNMQHLIDHTWSANAFKGTVVNRKWLSLYEGSLEFKFTRAGNCRMRDILNPDYLIWVMDKLLIFFLNRSFLDVVEKNQKAVFLN